MRPPAVPIAIRPARSEDIPSLVDVHIASWQSAYRGQVPDAVLDGMDATRSRRHELWRQMLANDRERALVAERRGEVVGFVNVGPARPPADASVGELYAIYLHPSVWGQGIGRAPFARGEEALRSLGYRDAILWVLETNRRARDFYDAAGWRADGETKIEELADVTLHEVRYSRSLAAR